MTESGVRRYCEVSEGLMGGQAGKSQLRAKNQSQEAENYGMILDFEEQI